MKLVLAEKPSVAQSIAKVLGAAKREDGYLEGNGYVVSWCVGHLVELAQPEVYGLPEMARMLGVHRQTIYYIVANEDFELIKVGRYKRATKESFEKWYQNQTRYQLAEDRQERS